MIFTIISRLSNRHHQFKISSSAIFSIRPKNSNFTRYISHMF